MSMLAQMRALAPALQGPDHQGVFDSSSTPFYGLENMGDFLSSGLYWLVVYLLPLILGAFVVYKGFSAPLRRREQSRMMFDLMEAGFRHGQRPETSLDQAAQTGDRSLGERFQNFAAQLRGGARLSEALEETPGLLPPQIVATLRVGEEVGDMQKVLPACRGLLRDAESATRSGFNYLVVASMVIMPVMPLLIILTNVLTIPRFEEIMAGSLGNGAAEPATLWLVKRIGYWVAAGEALLTFCIWCWIWNYVRCPRSGQRLRVGDDTLAGRSIFGGPLFQVSRAGRNGLNLKIEIFPVVGPLWVYCIRRPWARFSDWILYSLPWRRSRLQRDFCATLSLLLDSDTPEPAAITLAAEATANEVFVRRARLALKDLTAGKTLPVALRRFDQADEFSWRLANAAAQQGGFLPALAGWMEALDAKAFQQEQTASQLITTGLVLCNGLVVGLVAVGIFAFLTSLIG